MDLGGLNMISRVYSPSPMPSPLPSSLPDIPTRVLKLWCSACGWSVRKARSNIAAQVDTVVPKKNKTVHTTARRVENLRLSWGFVAWEFGGFGDPNKNPWIWPHRLDGSKWQVTMHGKWPFCGDENLYYPDFPSEVYLMDDLGGLNPPLVLTWLWNKIHPRVVINCINQEISGQHLPIRRNFRDVPTWMVFFCELRWDHLAKGKENTSKTKLDLSAQSTWWFCKEKMSTSKSRVRVFWRHVFPTQLLWSKTTKWGMGI